MSNELVALPHKQDLSEHFATENVQQALDMADQFFKAGCFGADVKNPHQAFVKIQAGKEMGMPPLEAMNSLYIVNGKITIWGSAMTKRLREFGWKIEYKEETNQCTAIITKEGERYEYTATADELKKLNSRAFGFAPKEKLRWHAISRLIRFNVPEILGCIMYAKEEAEDMRDLPGEVKDVSVLEERKADLINGINKAKNVTEFKEAAAKVGMTIGLTAEDMQEIREVALKKKAEIDTPKEAKEKEALPILCRTCLKSFKSKSEQAYLQQDGICLGCEKLQGEPQTLTTAI